MNRQIRRVRPESTKDGGEEAGCRCRVHDVPWPLNFLSILIVVLTAVACHADAAYTAKGSYYYDYAGGSIGVPGAIEHHYVGVGRFAYGYGNLAVGTEIGGLKRFANTEYWLVYGFPVNVYLLPTLRCGEKNFVFLPYAYAAWCPWKLNVGLFGLEDAWGSPACAKTAFWEFGAACNWNPFRSYLPAPVPQFEGRLGYVSGRYNAPSDGGWSDQETGFSSLYLTIGLHFAGWGAYGIEQIYPPSLRLSCAEFSDRLGNANGWLESGETGEVPCTISNRGKGSSGGTTLSLSVDDELRPYVEVMSAISTGRLKPGQSGVVAIHIKARSSLPTGTYYLHIGGRDRTGGVIPERAVTIQTRQTEPPHLTYEVTLSDDNGNGVFEAGEPVGFRLGIGNTGRGAAYGVRAMVADDHGMVVARESLGVINPAENKQVVLRFQMPVGVKDGQARYKAWLEEASGYAPGEQFVEVPVGAEAAVAFELEVEVDDDASDASRGNGDGAVDKGEAIELKVAVTNRGVSTARGVRVSILTNQAGVELRTPETSLGDIPEGESKDATLVFDVKQGFAGSRVEFVLNVTEQTGKFTGGEQLAYDLGKPAEAGVGLARPQFPKRPNTYALVVGISRYQDKSVVPLAFAENDARAVAGLLKANGIENVWELYGKDATRNQMMANLASLEELAKGDSSLVLVFFSGHGSPRSLDADQRGPYLMPYDVTRSSEKALQASSVSQADVTGFLDRCGAAAALVMVNACFFTGPQGAAGVGSMEPIRLQLPKARVVLSAARWDQYAYEDSSYKHSVFTYRLLDGLRGKAEAGTGDGWVDMGELVRYVGDNVSKDVASRRRAVQTPTLTGEGNFRITRCMR